MQRINGRAQLVKLAQELGTGADWHEPDEQGLSARVEGEDLDNAGCWPESAVNIKGYKGEFCVVLTKDGEDIAVVNLASLFSMAVNPNGPLR